MAERLLPSSLEAEKGILGSILIDQDAIHRVRSIIRPEMFHQPPYQRVFQVMLDLADEGIPPDYLSVIDALEQKGQKNASDIIKLIEAVPTSLHAEYYAEIVERDYIRRQAIAFSGRVAQAAYQSDDVADLMGTINQGVIDLEMRQTKSGPVPIATVVSELYDDLQYWRDNPLPPNSVRGLSTGIPEWDKMMGGMENGESFVIVAARPRSGKTALVISSAYNVAKMGKRVLVFALEMKGKTLAARLASADSQVSYKRIKRGTKLGSDWYASAEEYSNFTTGVLGISQAVNLYIDESQSLTVSQIRARAITLAHKLGGLDLIVVDTGNLVQAERSSGMNFAQVESAKVGGVRKLIKELDCVGYMTWQLAKGVDSRPAANFGRAPKLGDLRDTGGVEEHASDVIGVYRDELYVENTEYKNVMHLFGLKRRNDIDSTKQAIGFDPQFQRFYPVELNRKEIVY